MRRSVGRSRLLSRSASGGMAEVSLAGQAGAGGFEKVACLKRILPHLARDRQFVEMFLNEARLAARLDHPNIVSIFDVGEANGDYFIAMEFSDGPSLRAVAKRAHERGERLRIAEVVKIGSMAAGGLHYAHDLAGPDGKPLGLVHRDISPDNILVHRNGMAKVVDFGIAKAANSSGMTSTGTLKGKVAYMPPEQLRGDALDRRTDVFALGVVLYEMLGGKRPWEGDSEVSLIGRMMTEDPQPLSVPRPEAPAGLVAVLERALAKDRDARYASCHDLQADLDALLVSLGQAITPARISDFAKAYAEPVQPPDESTGAAMQALEAEMNGTGAVRAVPARRPQPREARTVVLPQPPAPPDRRGVAYGIAAFLCIAALGGAAGYAFLLRRGAFAADVVPIERASLAPRPAEPVAEPPISQVHVAEPAPSAAPPPTDAGAAPDAPPVLAQAAPVVVPAAIPPAPVPPAAPTPATESRQAVVAKPKRSVPPAAPQPAVQPVITAKGELVLLIRPWARVEV